MNKNTLTIGEVAEHACVEGRETTAAALAEAHLARRLTAGDARDRLLPDR